jgi:hypothetical protein
MRRFLRIGGAAGAAVLLASVVLGALGGGL